MDGNRTKYRTHTCGELRARDVRGKTKEGKAPAALATAAPSPAAPPAPPPAPPPPPETVTLAGHVDTKVDDASFLIRDRYGKTLVKADPKANLADRLAKLFLEDVVQVTGKVALRDRPARDLPTGDIHVEASDVAVLSSAVPLPDGILTDAKVPFDDRLFYRQLYLRRRDVQERLAARARLGHETREHLLSKGFLEIETPQLFWYDPVAIAGEIIPHGKGQAWRLSSGPVVLNQYVKGGQFDRYFQFTRITRRERRWTPAHQPEHTALDINMSYVDVPDLLALVDGMLAHLFRACLGVELKTPVKSLSYDEAMLRYGTDRVDARFGLEIADLGDISGPGLVTRAFRAPASADKLDPEALATLLADPPPPEGATLAWMRADAEKKLAGPAVEPFKGTAGQLKLRGKLVALGGANPGDLFVLASGQDAEAVAAAAGAVRLRLARRLGLIDESRHEPVWVHSYPFLERDEWDPSNLVARVVVFSQVVDEDQGIALDADKRGKVRAKAFDLMLDGVEVGSGYIGNYNLTVQRLVWKELFKLGTGDLFRLRAPIESHRFGVPPHGGMNIGFDRLVARLLGIDEIDEVMAFPKTARCRDPFLDAPGPVPPEVVQDLVEEAPKPEYTEADLGAEVAQL